MSELSGVAKVSGPVSVHEFHLTQEKTGEGDAARHKVIIFGDVHFSYDNLCTPCHLPTCQSVTNFIRARANAAHEDATSLDVFMEMPYVPPNGQMRNSVLKTWDSLMSRNAGPDSDNGLFKKLLQRLVGNTPFYIGVFSQLYKEFARDLYDDDYKRAAGRLGPGSVRFHYADARSEPNVKAALPVHAATFHKHVTGTTALRDLLHAFLFGKDFVSDVKMAGPSLVSTIVASALSTMPGSQGRRKIHKVAKQYHRLNEGPAKQAVRTYLEARIEEVINIMKNDVRVDTGVHTLAAVDPAATPTYNQPWLSSFREMNNNVYQGMFQIAMQLAVWVVIMDAYLLCRLLRFAVQTPESAHGTSIVYVGDAHAEFYVRFMRDYLGVPPVACQTRRSDINRCVDMAAAKRRSSACKL